VDGKCGQGSRVYNQGEDSQTIVISRSPLPSYRRDLDEQPNTRSSPYQVNYHNLYTIRL
jgi:hypothetical protein